jgi:penicillin-binding protein 2
LWQLQVWSSEEYLAQAYDNFINRTAVSAERGLIFDAKGRLVAGNRPSYDVAIVPAYFVPKDASQSQLEERIARLQRYLAQTEAEAQSMLTVLQGAKGLWRFEPIIVKRNISRDQVALLSTDSLQLPGVEVLASSQRHYPFNELAAHLLGYVNEINEDEYSKLKIYGYRPGDAIGRSGLERSFEAVLRGAPGVRAEVVDSKGIPQTDAESRALLGDWNDVAPVPGKNLVLTIDMDLQRILKSAIRGYETGAIVAIDPRNGHILGILSKPAYNPNSWSGRLSRDEHIASDNNIYKPMLDKALLSYFPGSIYKVITATAALEEGLIGRHESLHCPGYYEYGKRKKRFHCWKRGGHDSVALAEALAVSCDVYFYKVGEKLGMDKLAEYAHRYGLGERAGLGVNIEAPGLVPTREWHAKNSSEGFQGGFTLSTAIGQGDTRLSPLQAALLYGAIANNGKLYYPQIVERIETAAGQVLFEYPTRLHLNLDARPETLREISHGLDMVVNDEKGTAYAHRLDYVRVAGKTGTAQVTSQRTSNAAVEFKKRDHAWFVGYAPLEEPEIVVVVFLEHGGGGSSDATPVAMEVLDRYFREIRGYDPMRLKQNRRELQVLSPESGDSGQRQLLAEPPSRESQRRP